MRDRIEILYLLVELLNAILEMARRAAEWWPPCWL